MDDRTTIGDRPAGWRGSLTVSLSISVREYIDLLARLSYEARQLQMTTSTLLRQADLARSDECHDRALLIALEADGWQVTVVQQRR